MQPATWSAVQFRNQYEDSKKSGWIFYARCAMIKGMVTLHSHKVQ